MTMNENLIKARDDSQFLHDDLRAVYSNGSPLLAEAVAPLMEDAAKIRNRLEALVGAVKAEAEAK